MGGSVCVRVVSLLLERNYRIAGVAVLDVVEGSPVRREGCIHCADRLSPEFTLDALPHMHALLHTRPTGFGSVEEGIEWQ